MRILLRTAIVGMVAALAALMGAGQASAYVTLLYVWHYEPLLGWDDLKGWASFDSDTDQLCVSLARGYQASARIGGNSVTDSSANGASTCIWINNLTQGNVYTMVIYWWGPSGSATNQTNVTV